SQIARIVDAVSKGGGPTEPIRIAELKLPDLAYFVTTCRIADRAEPAVLRKIVADLQKPSPDLQFSSKGANELLCRAPTAARVREAMHNLRERLGKPIEFDEPFRCETFALALKVLRPEGPLTERSGAPW